MLGRSGRRWIGRRVPARGPRTDGWATACWSPAMKRRRPRGERNRFREEPGGGACCRGSNPRTMAAMALANGKHPSEASSQWFERSRVPRTGVCQWRRLENLWMVRGALTRARRVNGRMRSRLATSRILSDAAPARSRFPSRNPVCHSGNPERSFGYEVLH